MKKFGLAMIAIIVALIGVAFTKVNANNSISCSGYYYWFKVADYAPVDCSQAEYYLEEEYDFNNNHYPDYWEITQGSSYVAASVFGCNAESSECCALGYDWQDLEWEWPGVWKPKLFAYPQCVIFRNTD